MKNLCSVSTLAALVIFFLPWIDFKCSGQSMMTQSGMQSIYGGASPAGDAKKTSRSTESDNESLGVAWFVGLAFCLTLFAMFTLLAGTKDESNNTAGFMLGGALVMVVLQMVLGFPLDKKIADSNFDELQFDSMAKSAAMTKMSDPDADPGDLLAAQMVSNLDMSAKVEYMPPLFFELGALGLAMFFAFTTGGSSSSSRYR